MFNNKIIKHEIDHEIDPIYSVSDNIIYPNVTYNSVIIPSSFNHEPTTRPIPGTYNLFPSVFHKFFYKETLQWSNFYNLYKLYNVNYSYNVPICRQCEKCSPSQGVSNDNSEVILKGSFPLYRGGIYKPTLDTNDFMVMDANIDFYGIDKQELKIILPIENKFGTVSTAFLSNPVISHKNEKNLATFKVKFTNFRQLPKSAKNGVFSTDSYNCFKVNFKEGFNVVNFRKDTPPSYELPDIGVEYIDFYPHIELLGTDGAVYSSNIDNLTMEDIDELVTKYTL